MRRWMESHIHSWIDWGCIFNRITRMGSHISRGVSKKGFENEKIRDYEVVNVLPKVTVMGSVIGHRMF